MFRRTRIESGRFCILAAVVLIAFDATRLSAQESSLVQGEVATLELHDIRAANLDVVANLVASIVPPERLALIRENRQIAVFATPSLQQEIANQIATHEKNAILFEAIDISLYDPTMVRNHVEDARRFHIVTQESDSLNQLDYEFDVLRRRLLVWGSESDIAFIKNVVESLKQEDASKQKAQQVAGVTTLHHAETGPSVPEDLKLSQKPTSQSIPSDRDSVTSTLPQHDHAVPTSERKFLNVPRGPVTIVHIKELDLFLIRGR